MRIHTLYEMTRRSTHTKCTLTTRMIHDLAKRIRAIFHNLWHSLGFGSNYDSIICNPIDQSFVINGCNSFVQMYILKTIK